MLKKIFIIILIITIITLLFTSVRENKDIYTNEISIDQLDKTNLEFTYEQMLEDYDAFWSMIEENITFALIAVNNKGKNSEYIKKYYRNMINKNTCEQEFVDIIVKCINEFESVSHMKVVCKELRNNYMQKFRSSPHIIDVLNNSKSDVLYNTFDLSLKRLYSNLSKDKVDMSEFECVDESINAYISPSNNTAYIRFDDFSIESVGNTSRLINFYNKIADYDNLIIDVRNNRGGSTYVWKNSIVSLLASENIQYESYTLFNMGKNNSLFYTSYNPRLLESTITEKDWIYNTMCFKNTCKQNKGLEDVIVKSESTVKKSLMSINYCGRIWVLTNEKSFSAADTFSNFCKRTNFALIVGKKTNGNGISSIEEILCFYSFPNSGIIISYFPFMGFNADGTSNIESGDMPDVYTSDDALQACLKIINKAKVGK